eukprot:CAMPEP_0167745650 /NCGR_PEP_ID=MMETSP0110_2-20121227/3266_1 /TAXON_ID=629695 /ORGANISM="Gymnochlora sp., Strain CCMP2014" /LENGTH=68 /DNA_ID=CAMNT_0007630309 /DNA_START=841 /DNA_END=1044 /DNA_ORIENTATION=+
MMISACDISLNGHVALSASSDSSMRLWSIPDGKCIRTIICDTDRISSCALSANGEIAVSASLDGSLNV